jgi:DNA repair photolyase
VTTVDDEVRKKSELRSSPVEERLAALKEFHDRGVSTYAFLGPILPYITDSEADLVHLFEDLAEAKVDHVIVDRLNMRRGVWSSVVRFLDEHYPDLVAEYRRVFWSRNDYFQGLKSNITKLCDRYKLDCEFCF